ncbi:hypothetical protein [Bordetella avium]|uniref:hypothetical protein n=1 Tax=Bordetella avium TaxID=521 RepID=UPI000E0C01C7|nr:hypothetical protein [Bordetella avium]UOK17097.1 hypothetical protein vBBaMIFTN2_31 [Bordetella phage vB_BaM-IFTN2]UOK17221.1 hypothetical protein vBBaMIFTN4_29 [Bordetella phage vB_BaM-IFTN4]UOK17294.1 hypothetical protein vBBaMIFTN5_30 [Bordetella phage vB_BaM-IFTN5]UOK17363.1 hypothetical protein vBBaMIFTN6_30 [Bordetella phage vB_BaM-IFTN6]UOK17427.1 hypothetical protein vBBaMIFTN7_30 [Bordetella phage vB_BaM-IFTN7]
MSTDGKSEFDNLIDDSLKESERSVSQDKAMAQLSASLEKERDQRREERFLFVAIIVVLVDGYLFSKMPGWAGQIVIGLIQVFGLTVYARHCGVQEVERIIDKLLSFSPFHRKKSENLEHKTD